MPKKFSQILSYSLVFIVCVCVAGATAYFYQINHDKDKYSDEVIASFTKKEQQQAIQDRQDKINKIYQPLSDSLHQTDIFFFDANSAPILKLTAKSKEAQSSVDILRQKINDLLKSWQDITTSINNGSGSYDDLVGVANSEIMAIQEYVRELQDIIGGLQAGNGVSQQDIDNYHTIIDSVEVVVNNSAGDLADVINPPPSNQNTNSSDTYVPPNNPGTTNNQTQDVTPVNPADTTTSSGGNSGYTGDPNGTYLPPPPPPDYTGKPRLIEGTNTY